MSGLSLKGRYSRLEAPVHKGIEVVEHSHARPTFSGDTTREKELPCMSYVGRNRYRMTKSLLGRRERLRQTCLLKHSNDKGGVSEDTSSKATMSPLWFLSLLLRKHCPQSRNKLLSVGGTSASRHL